MPAVEEAGLSAVGYLRQRWPDHHDQNRIVTINPAIVHLFPGSQLMD